MDKGIDIRTLKLNKWYVPKTFGLEAEKNCIAIGYFDAVQVGKIQIDPCKEQSCKEQPRKEQPCKEHPFMSGYQMMSQQKKSDKSSLVDYSSQEQMLFTNICENGVEDGTCFSEETIRLFWERKDGPYMFLSMIHISHMGNLEPALEKIKETFQKNYLSYISFDYCDIIIFAKKISIKDFLKKVTMLFEINQKKRIIFDTFSMVSFHAEYAQEGKLAGMVDNDQFSATINLSVRDYKGLDNWYAKLQLENSDIRRYNMFGRHDISIVNNRADTKWLMFVMRELHKKENQKLFWTFETYIKVTDDEELKNIKTENPEVGTLYDKVSHALQKQIDDLKEAVEHSGVTNESSFVMPVCEVRDCICSIVKNEFSEEFIYCIYESFYHFMLYMTEKFNQLKNKESASIINENEIAKSYDRYFTALNTLVNSTMHSERQFIQATAFNAIFYTVPPKIMAFYNAYIYRVKWILEDVEDSKKFTYLIYPSFSPTMSIEEISLEEKPPCERILTVRIDEKTLYDVVGVTYQLVHELAHYNGSKVRCRDLRKRKIVNALLDVCLLNCEITDKDTIGILKEFAKEWIEEEGNIYLRDLNKISHDFLLEIKNDKDRKLETKFADFYQRNQAKSKDSDEELENIGLTSDGQAAYKTLYSAQYCKQKYEGFKFKMQSMTGIENINVYKDVIRLLESIYGECYADLQMIMVLAVNPEDYLNMFLVKGNVGSNELLGELSDVIRISIIFKVMTECKIWENLTFEDAMLSEIYKWIQISNEDAFSQMNAEENRRNAEQIKGMEKDIKIYKENIEQKMKFSDRIAKREAVPVKVDIVLRDYTIVTFGLYEYLLNVMEESLKEYQQKTKRERIKETREIIKTIFDFEDTIKAFNCIEKEIHSFREALFGIQEV